MHKGGLMGKIMPIAYINLKRRFGEKLAEDIFCELPY
jgi:hypothetical protein